MRRLAKELGKLAHSPPEGMRVVVQEDDLLQLSAWIEGPGASRSLPASSYRNRSLRRAVDLAHRGFGRFELRPDRPIRYLRVRPPAHTRSAGTPYEGGYFKIRFEFASGFPASPPRCARSVHQSTLTPAGWFITKIFHPNVAPSSGEVRDPPA